MNNTTLSMNRLSGVPFRGLVDFSVDHGQKEDWSATLSYWNGTAWVETPVWDPGGHLTRPDLLTPSPGEYVAGTVQVRASIAYTSLVTEVEFYLDSETSPRGSVAAPDGNVYTWNWDTAGVPDGWHTVRARGVDVWNGGFEGTVAVRVDRDPPVLALSAPQEGALLTSSSVTLRWSAGDAGSGMAEQWASLDGVSWTSVPAGTTSITFAPVPDGAQTAYVRARDFNGHETVVWHGFTVDTTPPTVSIGFPNDGDLFLGTEVTMRWSASDATSGIDTVAVSADSAPYVVVSGSSYRFTALSGGQHTLCVKATDRVGWFSEACIHVTTDATPPIVSLTSPGNGSYLASATVVLQWEVTDSESGLSSQAVCRDSCGWIDVGTGARTYSFTNVPQGSHTFYLRVVNGVGQVTQVYRTATVDLTSPVVSISSPYNLQTFAGQSITAYWNASDAISGIAKTEVRLDGGGWTTVSGTSYTFSGLSEGLHTLYVRVWDRANWWNYAWVQARVDLNPPTVSIARAPDYLCDGEHATITASASDAGGLSQVMFMGTTDYPGGASAWGPISRDTPDYWYNPSGGNTYTFSVDATDMMSRTTSASTSVSFTPPNSLCCKPLGASAPAPAPAPSASSPEPLSSTTSLEGSWPGEGTFLSPDAVTLSAGVGKSSLEAGYTLAGSRHRVVANVTQPLSAMTAAERSARILPLGLPGDLLSASQSWQLRVRYWSSGNQGSVAIFSLRVEETTSAAAADTDGDGLSDAEEVQVRGTMPIARDTDADGLADGYELAPHTLTLWTDGVSQIVPSVTTEPLLWDTDTDGLADGQERGAVSTGQSMVIGEVGWISNLTSSWRTVYLTRRYTSAVVVAEPTTLRGNLFGHVRIRNVGDHTFEARVENWTTAGGNGAREDVAYLVMEAGDYFLPDGTVVEAGTQTTLGSAGVQVNFREPFASAPMLLVQSQTAANSAALVAKVSGPRGTSSFTGYMNANGSSISASETLGYVAVSFPADAGAMGSWARAELSASSATATWEFASNYSAAPLVLAWYPEEGADGGKTLGLRLQSVTPSGVTVYRERRDTGTRSDEIDLLAFPSAMAVMARMATNPNQNDTDSDGLKDGVEVITYGSNPTLKDSDADSIPDGVEVATRTITLPVNGAMQTISVTTSPTSDDTDADGVKDPDELNGILDHRLLFYDMANRTDSAHLLDLSGNGYPGTMSGPTNTTSANALKVGAALDFDGANDYVTSTIPGMSALSSWSFSLWVQWDNGVSTAYQHPIGFGTVHDVTVYFARSNRALCLKATDASGLTLVDVALAAYTATTAVQPHHVAVTFDGSSLRAYVDGVATGPWAAPGVRIRSDTLWIGSSALLGSTYFDGRIDEVQVWDRTLTAPEVTAYCNLTSAGTTVAWLDMASRTPGGDLADFGGKGRAGVVIGTTVVEGRSGLARRFAGGSDGVVLPATQSLALSAVTVDAYVLLSSAPAADVSVVSRRGSFYLNLSSDGAVRWSLHGRTSVVSPLPIPLNRWVRLTATATASSLVLYVDGSLVATGATSAFPSSSNSVRIGYAEGQSPHLSGAVDQVLLAGSALDAGTLAGLGVRGIVLDPNDADTDGDGLPDGQELVVTTAKTAARYPVPDYAYVSTDSLNPSSGSPAWAIARVDAMVGVTHPDMGQLDVSLNWWVDLPGGSTGYSRTLLQNADPGQANNFTSFDLLQKPASGHWPVLAEFTPSRPTWYLYVHDGVGGKQGQVEYLQMQVTAHTLPNRADTDRDGLNDSEEVALGADGYTTNPWLADTDADGVADGLESTGWSWSGSTIVADANGFRTDPTRADTDRDGVPDGRDYVPLADAFITVTIVSAEVVSSSADDDPTPSLFEPFVGITDAAAMEYSGNPDLHAVASGGTAYFYYSVSLNVPDDAPTASVSLSVYDYDGFQSNGDPDETHEAFAVNGAATTVQATQDLTKGPGYFSPWFDFSGTGAFRAVHLRGYIQTVVPARISARLVLPSDYSGVYNVTDSAGGIMSRRYVGEPRFVALFLNVTDFVEQGHEWTTYPIVLFVPRAVFYETALYDRLAAGDASGVVGKLAFRQNATSAGSNSDALQAILSGNVTGPEYDDLVALLRTNPTGALAYFVLPLAGGPADDDPLFLYSLPDEAERLVAFAPLPSMPSTQYRFCTTPNCGALPAPKSVWEQIWDGIVTVVTAWIVSAVVLAVTAFRMIVDLLSQVGSWVAQAVATAAAVVASAVQAAAKVLGQVVDWAIGAVRSIVQGLLDPLISLIRMAIDAFRNRIAEALQTAFVRHSPSEAEIDPAASAERLYLAVSASALFMLVGLVVSILEIAEILTKPVSIFIAAAVAVIGGVIAGYLVSTLASASPTSGDQGITNGPEDGLGNRIVDTVPDAAWQDARTKWTLASILTTFTMRFFLTTLVETNLARSAELALASFFLWDFGLAVPALGPVAGLAVAGLALVLAAVSFLLAASAILERGAAPIASTVISVISLTSVILGLANLDRAVTRVEAT